MTEYKEDDFIMLSGIQHYSFCKRQWALIHIEQLWKENYLTTDGNIMHEKAHDGYSFEKRKDTVISRGMPIKSMELGITGVCDIVEFKLDKKGVEIYGREGSYSVSAVEYKRGKIKECNMDRLQVAAQTMCLEEMFCCTINKGYLYYGEMRKRVTVDIDEELRNEVRCIVDEMHKLFERRYTPKVKPTKSCSSCSLKEVCVPKMLNKKSVKEYMDDILGESNR